MLRQWRNAAGYTLSLYKQDGVASHITIEEPDGRVSMVREYAYHQAFRALYIAEVLAEGMGAKELVDGTAA